MTGSETPESSRPAAAFSEVLLGPWSQGFVVHAGMPLRSKSNFRRSRRGTHESGAWERSKAFEEALGWLVRSARPADWVLGERSLPVSARPVVVAAVAARSRIDVANFSKSVLDACEGVLYVTDASVLGVLCLGERGVGDDTLLGFAQLEPSASPEMVADALAALGSRLATLLSSAS